MYGGTWGFEGYGPRVLTGFTDLRRFLHTDFALNSEGFHADFAD
jgi:hypothetical protein